MKASVCGLVAALAVSVSCSQYDGPVLTSSDLVIYAPLPGSTTSVAYMTLYNHSRNAVILHGAHSLQFARVEMHETAIAEGVAHMRPLASLTIDAGSDIAFAVGGRHIMFLEPNDALGAGDSVSLELRYDDGGLLLLQAPLSTRTTN